MSMSVLLLAALLRVRCWHASRCELHANELSSHRFKMCIYLRCRKTSLLKDSGRVCKDFCLLMLADLSVIFLHASSGICMLLSYLVQFDHACSLHFEVIASDHLFLFFCKDLVESRFV